MADFRDWRWWEEKGAPSFDDFLDWRFRSKEHEGSGCRGVLIAMLLFSVLLIVVIALAVHGFTQ